MIKRDEATIIHEIAQTYTNLSPENLTCDGELSPSIVRRKRTRLKNGLDCLFRELGREISETEAYNLDVKAAKFGKFENFLTFIGEKNA